MGHRCGGAGGAVPRRLAPAPHPLHVRLSGSRARFGVISDVDDTILRTGAQRLGFPLGPLLLRDLLGDGAPRSHATTELASIAEVLDLHPDLRFVLIGDSGQHDPEIYAEVVRAHPHRVRAVFIREVRLDPGDGRVESVSDAWDHDVPFVLAADSATIARHAADLGLITPDEAAGVARASTSRPDRQPGHPVPGSAPADPVAPARWRAAAAKSDAIVPAVARSS